MSDNNSPPQPEPLSPEARRARKKRNVWLALALFAFVILVALTTVIRLGDSDLGPDGGFYWRNDPESSSPPMPDLPAGDEDKVNSEGDEQ
ncbi:MAG: hypothetical protein RIB03_14030 [Henriciella sp.]|uniref:hypothetical protein n=1 Tax=Henriciella sp. TaxID=1968823 RepID=UPI00262779D8|nr:hypothetical protein [Henriciella sp.]